MVCLLTNFREATAQFQTYLDGPEWVCPNQTAHYNIASNTCGANLYQIRDANNSSWQHDIPLGYTGSIAAIATVISATPGGITLRWTSGRGRYQLSARMDFPCGSSDWSTSPTRTVNVNGLGQMGGISGPTSINSCLSPVSYSIPAVGNATSYTWVVTPIASPPTIVTGNPVALNTTAPNIALNLASYFTNNTCLDLQVMANGCPPEPGYTFPDRVTSTAIRICREDFTLGTISGNQNWACNTTGTATYSIPAVTGATYNWTSSGVGFTNPPQLFDNGRTATFTINQFPAGSSANGIVSVSVTRCGVTKTQTLPLYCVLPPAAILNNSTGLPVSTSSVCTNRTTTFAPPQGTNFVWSSVPAGAFTLSRSGTNALVRANSATASGALLLTFNRPCDNQSVTSSVGLYTVPCSARLAAGEDAQEPLKVYPNPVSQTLHVENLSGAQPHQLQLHDAKGRLLRTGTARKGHATWDVRHLPNGLYILSLKDDAGVVERHKIVIQR